MIRTLSQPQTAALKNFRRLFWIRILMIAVFGIAAWAAYAFYDIRLPVKEVFSAGALMLSLNAFTWWRLYRPNPPSDLELLIQLLLDIAILSVLFYATGGYTNPFVWMYLLPLTVAAVALPWKHTWLIALLAVLCYSGLIFWYQPLPMPAMDMSGMRMDDMHMMHMQHQHENGFSVHLLGMWAGFVVSAWVIAFFVERMAHSLREYTLMLAEARERVLESERMLALGALATGAAHELGTPLATMAVLTQEMREDHPEDLALQQNLALIKSQIDRCKEIISSLTASAGQSRAEDIQNVPIDAFLSRIIDHWRDTRPGVSIRTSLRGSLPAPVILTDRTLGQALVNLLDNAADACKEHIDLQGEWTGSELSLEIRDDGPGLSPEIIHRIGTPFFTTKGEEGMGLGLYLARVIFGRFGGSVSLENHPQGGVLTRVTLPLSTLIMKENP